MPPSLSTCSPTTRGTGLRHSNPSSSGTLSWCPFSRKPVTNNLRYQMKLLNDGNHKTRKGEKKGWKTFGLHLAPHTLAGRNVCTHASPGCAAACLNTAGRGIMHSVQDARIRKTKYFFEERAEFLLQLRKEIISAEKRSEKNDWEACFRLNLTSDLPWHKLGVVDVFSHLQFYDYTKDLNRFRFFLSGKLPDNYDLTFSRSELTKDKQVHDLCNAGGNVAVVFRDCLPDEWQGIEVISGDVDDLRFKDPKGKIVGLEAKGLGKKDETGFVLEPNN
jgi:hypothetical protein